MAMQVLGVREIHYRANEPLMARYLICDVSLLERLNSRLDIDTGTEAGRSALVAASPELLKEYEHVIRFRDTRIYHTAYNRAIRKIQSGVRELVALRVLEGNDQYILKEGTLGTLNEGTTWTVTT